MLRLSAELTCCDSLILVLSEGGWGCESETYLVCAYLFTYSAFLARRNQPQPAASAMDQIPPLMMEWIQEHTTFSPQDFCGAAGTNFTGKSIFRSKTAPSRCCRALTRNSSQFTEMLGPGVMYRDNRCWGSARNQTQECRWEMGQTWLGNTRRGLTGRNRRKMPHQ